MWLKLLSSNIQAGSITRAYSEYVTRSWSHVWPNGKQSNLDALARTYSEFDLVGLQECDSGSLRSGFSNQAEYLAGKAQFAYSSHQANRRISHLASSGNALLSRLKPNRISHTALPGLIPGRGVLLATFGEPGHEWHVAVTHLSLSARARRIQIAYLSELLAGLPRLVMMGDFNCNLYSPEMSLLFKHTALQAPETTLLTFPSWAPKRAIDHILVGGMACKHYQTYLAAGSDHLAIALEVQVPALNPVDSPSLQPKV